MKFDVDLKSREGPGDRRAMDAEDLESLHPNSKKDDIILVCCITYTGLRKTGAQGPVNLGAHKLR